MMRFEFVRVGPDGRITGRCWAEDARAAARRLVPGPSSYLTSAASYAIGVPRAVKAALAAAPQPLSQQQAAARRANVAKAQAAYKKRQREATPLAPAIVREGRAVLEQQMRAATAGKVGRPRKAPTLKASTLEAKRRHERKPDRRAAKTAWQRAKRRGEA